MGIDGIQPEARRRDGDVRAPHSTPRFDLRRYLVDALAQRYVLSAEVFVRPAEFDHASTQRLPGIRSLRDAPGTKEDESVGKAGRPIESLLARTSEPDRDGPRGLRYQCGTVNSVEAPRVVDDRFGEQSPE